MTPSEKLPIADRAKELERLSIRTFDHALGNDLSFSPRTSR